MTVNDLLGKIENRIKELGKLSTDRIRLEHPDAQDTEITTVGFARRVLKGKSREEMIAEIIVEEFSTEFETEL